MYVYWPFHFEVFKQELCSLSLYLYDHLQRSINKKEAGSFQQMSSLSGVQMLPCCSIVCFCLQAPKCGLPDYSIIKMFGGRMPLFLHLFFFI
jgi:hypothetical protein